MLGSGVPAVVGERSWWSAGEELELQEERHRVVLVIAIVIRVPVERWRAGSEVDTLPWEACSDRCSPWPVFILSDWRF